MKAKIFVFIVSASLITMLVTESFASNKDPRMREIVQSQTFASNKDPRIREIVQSQTDAIAKNENQDCSGDLTRNTGTISLVSFGEGATIEEATKNALRSAIEQAFGTFVSAKTEVINDELVSDEIATISSGNIQGYKVISSVEKNSSKEVSVEAVVSIEKLVSYAQNKGMATELSGATFMMNKRMRDLNKKSELLALVNLRSQLWSIFEKGCFDYKIEVLEPQENVDGLVVLMEVTVLSNENLVAFNRTFRDFMKSLSMPQGEIEDYEKTNVPYYTYNFPFKFNLRAYNSPGAFYFRSLHKLLRKGLWMDFVIKDNLSPNGNREFETKFDGWPDYLSGEEVDAIEASTHVRKQCLLNIEKSGEEIVTLNIRKKYSGEEMNKLEKIEIVPSMASASSSSRKEFLAVDVDNMFEIFPYTVEKYCLNDRGEWWPGSNVYCDKEGIYLFNVDPGQRQMLFFYPYHIAPDKSGANCCVRYFFVNKILRNNNTKESYSVCDVLSVWDSQGNLLVRKRCSWNDLIILPFLPEGNYGLRIGIESWTPGDLPKCAFKFRFFGSLRNEESIMYPYEGQ